MSGYDGRGGKFDIIAPRGSDMAFTVTATSGGSAVNLSAATIAGELYATDGTVADTMTAVVSGAGNIITLSFTDAETLALASDSYPWTLWVTRGGDKRPWLAGRVRVVDPSSGVQATNGDAVTLTVDSDINVSIDVSAIGTSGVPLTTAAVAPSAAPNTIGELYVNSVTNDLYIATGTATVADWTGILTA